jgi:glycerol-3-phosphate dehydrogenase
LNRALRNQNLSNTFFDLLIIGGGITGAGIALDASSRGLKVALIEKSDFASGTSSKSTKLIHGGLRYLKQGDFKLVREVGMERAILYKNAPHIVIPEKMLMPFTDKGTFGKTISSIGLWIYDWLAGVPKPERRKILNAKEALQFEPLLEEKGLLGAAMYYEYRTDDARLTLDVLKTAQNYGAIITNYSKTTSFIYKNDLIVGANVFDNITSETFKIHATKVINATGPWVDTIRQTDFKNSETRLKLTKGVHLVVPHQKFPINQSIYFDVPDGRMLFAIPRGKTTYFGTTDTDFHDLLENPLVTNNDVKYLIDSVNQAFPKLNLSNSDIISSWAGLRPLIKKEGKKSTELSRKDEIFISTSGLISIAGGKLTGYRKMAERVVNLISNKPCVTENIAIVRNESDEVDYMVQNEWVESIQDFVIRRTDMLYFEPQKLQNNLVEIANKLADLKQWNIIKKESELVEIQKLITQSINF